MCTNEDFCIHLPVAVQMFFVFSDILMLVIYTEMCSQCFLL